MFTTPSYRHILFRDTASFATAASPTRVYGLNVEHCQSEACAELANVSHFLAVTIKGEGARWA